LRQKQTTTTKQNRSGTAEKTTKCEMAKFNTTGNVRNRPNASAKPGNAETEVTKVRRTRVTKDGKTTSTTEVTRGKK